MEKMERTGKMHRLGNTGLMEHMGKMGKDGPIGINNASNHSVDMRRMLWNGNEDR
jgi:hypothetical protein